MRVLHVPYTYYPDPVGGTEIYVEQLAKALGEHGIQSTIAAPGKTRSTYEHAGICVERLAVSDRVHDITEMYGDGDESAGQDFGMLLDNCKPDVVHLHAFTRIVSVYYVEQAHVRGIPVVFTYHTPTVSCLRSGLMRWGREECDGILDVGRCTSCRLHSLGLPMPVATIVARMPYPVRALGHGHQGGAWTALRMRDLVADQHASIHKLMANVDRVVALCEWTRQVLLVNQVPAEKIAFVPHGFTLDLQAPFQVTHNAQPENALRVVTLGRLEPIKGIDLLVHALAQLPTLPITLDIYGIVQSESETRFARQLRASIARDPRVRLLPPVPHSQVISLLQQYDVMAAPSQWFETGPLVGTGSICGGHSGHWLKPWWDSGKGKRWREWAAGFVAGYKSVARRLPRGAGPGVVGTFARERVAPPSDGSWLRGTWTACMNLCSPISMQNTPTARDRFTSPRQIYETSYPLRTMHKSRRLPTSPAQRPDSRRRGMGGAISRDWLPRNTCPAFSPTSQHTLETRTSRSVGTMARAVFFVLRAVGVVVDAAMATNMALCV